MPNTDANILALVQAFARQITAAVEASAVARVRAVLTGAFGAPAKRGPGRPPKSAAPTARTVAGKPAARRKAPRATAALIRARKLQGQYLGALRALGAAAKAKVKAMAKEKGVAQAVKLALTLRRKA
jgi:hypothetical protein